MTDARSFNLNNGEYVSSDCLYNLKASSVRARSYRAAIPTSNGQSFTGGQTAILYIPCGRKNTFMDPQQTYLKFTVKNNDGTNAFFIDNLATSFINRLDTFHSSNMLDSIQQYNVLASYLKDFTLNTAESQGLSSIYGTSTSDKAAEQRQGLSIPKSSLMTFCIPLLGSVFSNADKMIPIGQMYDDIRVEITWEANTQAIAAAAGTPTWTITDCQLMAQIIELNDDGMAQVESATPFSSPVYLHTNSFRHYVTSLPSGSAGTFSTLVPARFCSARSLIMCPRRSVEIADALGYSISARFNPCISSYWWRIGAAMVPQKPIVLYNSTSVAGYGEAYAEIQKSFHSLGRADMCSGILVAQYNATDVVTASIDAKVPVFTASAAATTLALDSYKAAFAIGQELETFANRSDLLLSGLNTLSSQVFWECNLGLKADASLVPTTNHVLDFYCQFDQILVLENGILSARF